MKIQSIIILSGIKKIHIHIYLTPKSTLFLHILYKILPNQC